jgi:cytosine/adenosine deaminase-related metal-dependent hydrolase
VTAVGKAGEFSASGFDRTIDLSGHIIMPGFVNAHSHLQLSAARGKINRDVGFVEWVRRVIDFSRAASGEERDEGMRRGIAEMLATGTTAVGDIVSDARFAAPLAASKLRGVVFVEAIAPLEKDAQKASDTMERQLEALWEMGVTPGISPHAPHTVSRRLFRLLTKLSQKHSLIMTTHAAESGAEDEYLRNGTGEMRGLLAERGGATEGFEGYGVSPVRFLDECGALERLLAVHLNTVNDGDVELLRTRDATPLFCPGSSRWFKRERVMPLDTLFNLGIRPALGTDSLASNFSLSMLDELRAAAEYFPLVDRARLVEAATLNGGRALGLECGSIAKGKRADIIAFAWNGKDDPLDCIFRATGPDFVMIGGEGIPKAV